MPQAAAVPSQTDFAAPLEAPIQRVLPEWLDYNGHMNIAYYSLAFDKALDHFFDALGIGWDYTRSGAGSAFALENHLTYLREVHEGDPLRITFQLLGYDPKRIHFIEQMYHAEEGFLSATSEQIAMHVSMETRRAAPFPPEVLDRVIRMRAAHAGLAVPPQVGHVIGLPRKPAQAG